MSRSLPQGLSQDESALLTHGDAVTKIAPGFRATAWSQGHVVGIECAERRLYGTQFHPEVDLTVGGNTSLRRMSVRFKVESTREWEGCAGRMTGKGGRGGGAVCRAYAVAMERVWLYAR